ncbi:putative Rz-like protein [Pseudomonas phage MR18]|nr:putative Rz-like protein [Pseudomonas phage MR18]
MSTGMDMITGVWVQEVYRNKALCVSVERMPPTQVENLPMESLAEIAVGAVPAGTSWTSPGLGMGEYPRPPQTVYVHKVSSVLTLVNEELECSQDNATWWPAVMAGTGLSTLVKAVAGARAFGASGVPIGRYVRVRLKAGLTATGADTKVRIVY